jgi:hypothetical protein
VLTCADLRVLSFCFFVREPSGVSYENIVFFTKFHASFFFLLVDILVGFWQSKDDFFLYAGMMTKKIRINGFAPVVVSLQGKGWEFIYKKNEEKL